MCRAIGKALNQGDTGMGLTVVLDMRRSCLSGVQIGAPTTNHTEPGRSSGIVFGGRDHIASVNEAVTLSV
ncbi:hypothetical protein K7X08_021945 [Anisodus acutangulus]|uniref:Uncharacterized protein n=1 Tax=Anisodus acutangulus TaxID=402998 RepID=A0A9Q1QUT8_9SOLA|nr:hypothetical protein K7X08_021945 [Anisodus acutangulus]